MCKIVIKVSQHNIDLAKRQVEAFEQIEAGQYRYEGVEAWRGVVCEMLVSEWLTNNKNFNVQKQAKGLDDSGVVDEYDMIVNGKKVEIKSATCNYYKYIMPKIHDVDSKPKDIYICAKYNETVEPNEVYILGYIELNAIKTYDIKRNKGAPYYEIPIVDLHKINENMFG